MKTLAAAFETQKNRKTGAKPVWILKCPFVAGTVYLSDRAVSVSPWSITTKSWISSWGTIDEDITNILSTPIVSDLSLSIIIDPNEATDIHDLLWSESVETIDCELYLWFEDLTAATDPVLIWVGNIIDFIKQNELTYTVTLVDQGVKLEKYPGRVLSITDYPNAATGDVGKQMPIIYGNVDNVPILGLDVAAVTSIPSALSGTTGLAAGSPDNTKVANAAFTYTISGTNYTCAADAAGTVPGNDTIPQSKYGAISLDIGTDGVIHVIEAPDNATGYNTAALAVAGLPAVASGHARMGTVTVTSSAATCTFGTVQLVTQGFVTVEILSASLHTDFYLSSGRGISDGDSILIESEEILVTTISGDHVTASTRGYNSTTTAAHVAKTLVTQVKSSDCVYMFADHPAHSIGNIYGTLSSGISVDVTSDCTKYTGQTGSELAGYEGKAVIVIPADTSFADRKYFAAGEGYQDGSAALIERPDLIMEHFLYTYAAWPTADFITDADTSFTADGYIFSVVMNERKRLRDWLSYMALQCRCFFRFAAGDAYLLYRPDALTSDKTITASMIAMHEDYTTTTEIARSMLDEVINKIDLKYSRDWTLSGDGAYQAIASVHDDTSITAYGEKEQPETFMFDFVADATMAADLAAFYLARYKDRKKVVTMNLFLDNVEIEFADGITITPLGDLLCEVRKVGVAPGSAERADMIVLTAREY